MAAMRFGYQVARLLSAAELRQVAADAEAVGFDVLHTADHVGPGWAPLSTLAVIAEATTTLRVCPLVLNNDFHDPVQLAREVAAIDHLSGGRMELGLGAGHSFDEYAAIGLPFDPPAVRKARLAEAVEILRRLLDGEEVSWAGEHYQLDGVRVMPALQDRLPILVGVNGRAALTHAAEHADIVAPTMLGRTLEDGHHHEVRWEATRLDRTVDHIREAAAAAGRDVPRLHALVQVVVVSDDRRAAAAQQYVDELGITLTDALATPFLALGTHDEIAVHLLACRERWGIDYFTVRDIDAFAPVIARLRASGD